MAAQAMLVMQWPAEQAWLQRKVAALDLLVQHTVRKASWGQIKARQLANVGYGAACSGSEDALVVLFTAWSRAAELEVGKFSTLVIRGGRGTPRTATTPWPWPRKTKENQPKTKKKPGKT